MSKLKRITRTRRLTPEEAAKYNKIREQIVKEFPPVRQKLVEPGQRVLPRAGSRLRKKGVVGVTTGATRYCPLEGCTGTRIVVRWPGGTITYPCSKGMLFDETTHTWEIQ